MCQIEREFLPIIFYLFFTPEKLAKKPLCELEMGRTVPEYIKSII